MMLLLINNTFPTWFVLISNIHVIALIGYHYDNIIRCFTFIIHAVFASHITCTTLYTLNYNNSKSLYLQYKHRERMGLLRKPQSCYLQSDQLREMAVI